MLLGARHPMQSSQPNPDFHPRWFVRGDIDGFFGLALDNLIQVLLISSLWTHVLGFSPARLYDRVLPGIAISLVSGNLFYAWQAYQLAKRSGRTDVSALPYGINTVSGRTGWLSGAHRGRHGHRALDWHRHGGASIPGHPS
jgi:hypothetical protein